MSWNVLSFLLSEEEAFLELNPNFLETNAFNIFLLLALLIYAYKVSFSKNLAARQEEIVQTIENAQNDLLKATEYYHVAEKGYGQTFFWLQSWKTIYEKEKVDIVESKYKQVKKGFNETFATTANLIQNLEKKAFLSLQRYILFLTASRILRKFLVLSPLEKSKLLQGIMVKLGGGKK